MTIEQLNKEMANEINRLEEAQRRYNAYKAGAVSSRDVFEAIADIRGQLRHNRADG